MDGVSVQCYAHQQVRCSNGKATQRRHVNTAMQFSRVSFISFPRTTVILVQDLRQHLHCLSSSHTGTHLFGFDVRQLIGRHVSSFLDILRETPGSGKLGTHASLASQGPAAGGGAGTPAGGDPAQGAVHHHERGMDALMELAQRSTEDPGSSWRVGVSMPVDEEDLALLGPMAAAMLQQRTHPAVMTLAVSFQLPQGGHGDAGDIAASEDSGGGVIQKGTQLLIGSPGGIQISSSSSPYNSQPGNGVGAGKAPAAIRALQHHLYSNPAFSPQMGAKRGPGSFLFSGPPEPIAESSLHHDDGFRAGGVMGARGGAGGGMQTGRGGSTGASSTSFWFPFAQQQGATTAAGPVAEATLPGDGAPAPAPGAAGVGSLGHSTVTVNGGTNSIAPGSVVRSKLGPLVSSSLVEDQEAAEALMMQHQLLLDSAESLRRSSNSEAGAAGVVTSDAQHQRSSAVRAAGPRPKTTPVGTRGAGVGQLPGGGVSDVERTSMGLTSPSPELSLYPPGGTSYPIASPVDEVTQELFPHDPTFQAGGLGVSSSLTRGVSNNYGASSSPFTSSSAQHVMGGNGGAAGGAASSLPPHMRGGPNKPSGITGHSLGGAGPSLMGAGTLARAASLRPAMLFAAAQAAASASLPMHSRMGGGNRSAGETPPMTANNSMTRVSQPNTTPQLIHSSG
jgi:hypothetical protein